MNSLCRAFALAFLAVLTVSSAVAQQSPPSPTASVVATADDLLAQPVGANWTSYNGDYTGRRYSSLREINPQNVAQLRASWTFHPGNSERLEVTPVVVNGVMTSLPPTTPLHSTREPDA